MIAAPWLLLKVSTRTANALWKHARIRTPEAVAAQFASPRELFQVKGFGEKGVAEVLLAMALEDRLAWRAPVVRAARA